MQSELCSLQDKIRGLEEKLQLGSTKVAASDTVLRENQAEGVFTFHNTEVQQTMNDEETEPVTQLTLPRIKDKISNKENYQLQLNALEDEEREVLEESMRLKQMSSSDDEEIVTFRSKDKEVDKVYRLEVKPKVATCTTSTATLSLNDNRCPNGRKCKNQ